MEESIYIGIDNGTQGTKVCAFSTKTYSIIAEASAKHDIIENENGRREQDPKWWIDAASSALKEIMPKINAKLVKGISVSGQQHGCVPLDEKGNVLRPAKLWCDTETVEECKIITDAVGGPDKVIAEIGNSIATGFTASKVLWIKRHEPEVYKKIAHILLPHDYLNYWLTGNYVTEMGDASGTAYFDIRKRQWSEKILKAIDPDRDLRSVLPEVKNWDDAAGKIRPEIAKQFGLPEDVIVGSGGGDNMMAAIGTGCVQPGTIACSLGTSGTIFTYDSSPVVDPNGELAAFCSSSGGWLPLICTMNVTVATEQTRNIFGLSIEEFNKEVEKAPPGSGGIILVPYFNGERTPARPTSHASFSGITTVNFTRANMCRASMEGVTLGLRYGINILENLNIKPKMIICVGGGSKSSVWRQIIADVFRCSVCVPSVTEAGALGCVIQAICCVAKASGKPIDIKEVCQKVVKIDEKTKCEPNQANVALYEKLFKEYLALDKKETL